MRRKYLVLITIILLTGLAMGCVNEQKHENIESENSTEVMKEDGLIDGDCLSFRLDRFPHLERTLKEFSSKKVVGEEIYLEEVETAEDVVKSLEPIFIQVYGEEEVLTNQRPYIVKYDEETKVWLISGTGNRDMPIYGVIFAIVSKEDGKLLAIWGEE